MLALFKSKFFIIALIVIVVLTVLIVVLNLTGHSNIISDVMNTVLYPFQKFADAIRDSAGGFIAYFTEFNNLKEKNEELRLKLEETEKTLELFKKYKEENDMLFEYFDLKREHMDFKFRDAEIITREADNFNSDITINRGTFHGVAKGMAVVNGENVVGFVSETELFTSKVTLMLKPDSSIGAYIERSKETGLITGDFALEKDGLCLFNFTSKETTLEIGDKIVTSGLSDIYPKGLIIGKVVKVEPDALKQNIKGHIKPEIDLYKIKHVMVILDFERKFE